MQSVCHINFIFHGCMVCLSRNPYCFVVSGSMINNNWWKVMISWSIIEVTGVKNVKLLLFFICSCLTPSSGNNGWWFFIPTITCIPQGNSFNKHNLYRYLYLSYKYRIKQRIVSFSIECNTVPLFKWKGSEGAVDPQPKRGRHAFVRHKKATASGLASRKPWRRHLSD